MINSTGTFSKHSSALILDGLLGVKGPDEFPVFSEVKLNVEVLLVGIANELTVQGRLQTSAIWRDLGVVIGPTTGIIDISSYDYIRFNVTTNDGVGVMSSSGFITDKSGAGGGGGGAGDASAANQAIGNATLSSINNKTPGSLLANRLYDDIQVSYPTTSTEVYRYYSLTTLTATVTITYTDSTKAVLLRTQRT